MTICIGVIVHDCLVFVADSASTHVERADDGVSVSRVYNSADKVFNLHRTLPICGMTCGIGNFGSDSVATIAKGIRHELMFGEHKLNPSNYTIEYVAQVIHDRFTSAYSRLNLPKDNGASFSFFVGGYNKVGNGNEVWKTQIVEGKYDEKPIQIAGTDNHGVIWDGQPEACIRLVQGHSTQSLSALTELGITNEQALKVIDHIQSRSQVQVCEPAMPTRDAIRLAKFLAETTVGFVEFLPGANTVGGDLDIAVVTKYEGFRWIARKHYYPNDLNQETNHDR